MGYIALAIVAGCWMLTQGLHSIANAIHSMNIKHKIGTVKIQTVQHKYPGKGEHIEIDQMI